MSNVHSAQVVSDGIHIAHSLVYADAAARTGASLAAADVGRIALQSSDTTFWILSAAPSTWIGLGAGAVASVFTRTGAVVAATNDYTDLQIQNTSSVSGTGVKGALNTLLAQIAALVTGVSTVFSRSGAVVAAAGDYAASQVTNDSSVTGSTDKDALNRLLTVSAASVITDSTTARTLALADAGSWIEFSNASAVTVTIPTNASVAFVIGTTIPLTQAAAGKVTAVGAGGVTVKTSTTAATAVQEATIAVTKIATDTWRVTGDRG